MTVFACSMVKDEADIIGATLLHLADENIDGFIVADNGSTDGTRDLLADFAKRMPLTVVDDPDPAYFQSHKMTHLARLAAAQGATWIVPFDADELWVGQDRIGNDLEACEADIVTAELLQHFPTGIDPPGKSPFETIVWRQRDPAPLPKVAFRWHDDALIHQGNHGVTLPGTPVVHAGLSVRHFPYRSAQQFVNKARNGAAAYRAADLPLDVGAHWRGYGDIIDRYGPEALEDVFREHFWALSPADKGWLRDPAPYRRWR